MAQADFRANDRDGNHVQDFWTGDICGLYVIEGEDGTPIKLVEIAMARADAHPVSDTTLLEGMKPTVGGYYFASLHPPGEKNGRHPSRFAACSYPVEYGVNGVSTFIINEENTIFRKDLGRSGGIDHYPDDPVAEGWTKLD